MTTGTPFPNAAPDTAEKTAAPERDLSRMLAGLRPELRPGRYAFTIVSGPDALPAGIDPVVTVAEPEGLTLVVRQEEADAASLAYDYVAGWITLRVHSALDAVGLTAAVAGALADAGLSCNVVAGFHHDHLFVEHAGAERALAVLEALSEGGREATP
ncbi:ACT domain-containing protein [Streptomyces sp. NPDC048718]|uniref:ACT domain-containing protein n=1 Tax=Streptomyces sp. NPDC048718 TaxID=3365587 RepID=UPI00371C4424